MQVIFYPTDIPFVLVCYVLDVWRPYSPRDALRNGEAATSSLAAKGFRSVRPNLQDKKSSTTVSLAHSVRLNSSASGCFFLPQEVLMEKQ